MLLESKNSVIHGVGRDRSGARTFGPSRVESFVPGRAYESPEAVAAGVAVVGGNEYREGVGGEVSQ